MRLVDTSAWVEVFRRPQRLALADLAPDPDCVVTCLPVIQEVLQGFDDDRAHGIARVSMFAWRSVDIPLGADVVERAVQIYRQARRAGVTVRSTVDCLVAASALGHGLTVVHCDRDFAAIARVTGLRHEDLSPRLRPTNA
ncbi:MAG: PIN domain-containing protein [Acidobacteria bacterium]|nr:PIN domain-containing protein [Acidobacteriota bacterium]